MIIEIDSDLPTFKAVRFGPGLNILLADKAPKSGDRQTRNSAGKSSLIEIVHFLLGGKPKGSLPCSPALVDYTFYGTFFLSGYMLQVARTGTDPGKIFLSAEDAEALGLSTKLDKKSGRTFIGNEAWKAYLGHVLFALPADPAGTPYKESFSPTFRAMIAYFIRRRGGFMSAQLQSTKQQPWDSQVNLSYLLGLDWSVPSQMEAVRQRERQLTELRKAAKGGAVGEIIGTVAELRPKMVRAQDAIKALKRNIAEFRVLDTYREWSDQASTARNEMLAIERQAVPLKQMLAHVEAALEDERAPQTQDLQRLYKAVGIELPGVAVRRFEEVQAFHLSVVTNRRARLEVEASELRRQIKEGEERTSALDDQRSEILRSLDGHGAFEDLMQLQSQLAKQESEAASLAKRFEAAEVLEGSTTQLEIDRANLKRRLQEDHQARKGKIDRAILIIGRTIEELYQGRTGEFVVEAGDGGPSFDIKIQGDRGGGISQMEIFCLDLALLLIGAEERRGMRFLVHDSHLFDGVDERQIARALWLGGQAADLVDGQYIVTMNSDVFDRLPLPDDFDYNDVLEERLSDEGETGGLFGFRFD